MIASERGGSTLDRLSPFLVTRCLLAVEFGVNNRAQTAEHKHPPAALNAAMLPQSTWRCRTRGRAAAAAAAAATRGRRTACIAQQGGNVLVSGIVGAMTESLRLLGVGQQEYRDVLQQQQAQEAAATRLAPGDVSGVMAAIQDDYARAYFVTGLIDGRVYDPECVFADPTVKFAGLDLWRRNLQLLVPFLLQPSIELLSMVQLPDSSGGSGAQLQAEWTLETGLALPWRPFVSVRGKTRYTLNAECNMVVEHVEEWDVSATQALLQLVTPGGRRQRHQPQ